MAKKSAGILVFKRREDKVLVLLVHPGGPFWEKKDAGSWSIPKGEFDDSEDPFTAARREFSEEIGQGIDGSFMSLTPQRQPSRKIVYAWAVEGNIDESNFRSNEFEMEWPPKSGNRRRFPEVDRISWFPIAEAKDRIQPGQVPILEELVTKLGLEDQARVADKPRSELL